MRKQLPVQAASMARQILQLQGSLEAIESDKEGEDIMQRISW
jgi:hypothetical protein